MIQVPHIYAEWVQVLEIFKNKSNDSEVLNAMRQGTIDWQSGVAERFSRKLIDAVNARMNAASDKFQLDMSRAHGQESAMVQAILTLRKEMHFLIQAIDLPIIPKKERDHYIKLVMDQADTMQRSLEDSARRDRSGRLSSIVRNHKINAF